MRHCALSSMASHFLEELDAASQISVVSIFLAPESDPVGIFKDFKIQLLCLGPLKARDCLSRSSQKVTKIIFPPPSEKKKQNKNISVKKQGNILCFLQRFENDMNEKETSSAP